MNKILSIALSLLLCLAFSAYARAAEPFDLSYIQNSSYVSDGLIRVEEKDAGTFVYNNFEIKDLAFSFIGESDSFYSYADFDIGVFHEEDGTELPLLRLWFTLWTEDKSPDISSLTLTGHRCSYTFSDLYDPDFLKEDEGDFSQDVLLLFDFSSMQCLGELMRLRELMKVSSDWKDATVKAVFHGTEDLSVELGENFWNIFDVYLDLYLNSNGSVNMGSYEGTPMEVVPLS